MKKVTLILLISICVANCESSQETITQESEELNGENNSVNENKNQQQEILIINFNTGVSEDEKARLHTNLGTTLVKEILNGRTHVVRLSYPTTLNQIIEAYKKSAVVRSVERNQTITLPENPTK